MTEPSESPVGTEAGPHRAGPIRMLRRSRTNRKVAGVCGGLGAYTNVDPLIYRVLFAVFSLFGGFGLFLYGAAWLIIPDEGEERSEGQRLLQGQGTSTSAAWALVATVLGFIVFLAIASDQWNVVLWIVVITAVAYFIVRSRRPAAAAQVGAWWSTQPPASAEAATTARPAAPGDSAPPSATATAPAPPVGAPPVAAPPMAAPPPTPERPKEPPSVTGWLALSAALVVAGLLVLLDVADVASIPTEAILASVLATLGAGLLVATWFGRARSLIIVGLVVMAALALVDALGTTLRGRVGELEVTPASVRDLEDQPYEVSVGALIIDLRELDPVGLDRTIEASVGMGVLEVVYPDDVRIEATADVHVGVVDTFEDSTTRVTGDDVVVDPREPSRGIIRLDLEVGMGNIAFREEADER